MFMCDFDSRHVTVGNLLCQLEHGKYVTAFLIVCAMLLYLLLYGCAHVNELELQLLYRLWYVDELGSTLEVHVSQTLTSWTIIIISIVIEKLLHLNRISCSEEETTFTVRVVSQSYRVTRNVCSAEGSK